MTPLVLTLLLLQAPLATPATAPAKPAAAAPAAEAPPNPEDTLQGLEQVYSSTCGQTGILYHAYDDLCESLRKQMKSYREKIEREQAKAAATTKATAVAPKR